jgi:acetyl-CoA acyltransferase
VGLTGENVAARHDVRREDQDAFALRSHRRALDAIDAGRFRDEVVPVEVARTRVADGEVSRRLLSFDVDEGPRRDTSLEALAALPPVFLAEGTITAGTSSQTSDGAAATVLADGATKERLGARPLARFLGFALSGLDPAVMGMGPVGAVRRLLERTGVALADVGLVELNEAFAAQALAVIRALDLDEARVNVNGGAIALGHPLGCTGAKLTATLLHEMRRRRVRLGIVTMCVGGGMGAAGLFENPEAA